MKKYSVVIGFVFILLVLAYGLNGAAESRRVSGKEKQVVGAWERKEAERESKSDFPDHPFEEGRYEKTDIETVRKLLGFEFQLPASPKAAAAGEPKFWVYSGVVDEVDASGTPSRPQVNRTGAQAMIEYPNGLQIGISILHPKDATVDYEKLVPAVNKERSKVQESDGKMWRLTKVKNVTAQVIDKGFDFVGVPGHDDPNENQFRQPRKAVIVWYDPENWAEYCVRAPFDIGLEELAELVGTM